METFDQKVQALARAPDDFCSLVLPPGAGATVFPSRAQGAELGARYRQSLQSATWPLMKSRQGQILRCLGWAPAQLNSRRSP